MSNYYPYGEEKTVTADEQLKFATYRRDSESRLDYAGNRYYSAPMGRFLSADPYGGSMDPSNPQSFNRYAYVMGDPVNRNDVTGLGADFGTTVTGYGDHFDAWLMEAIYPHFIGVPGLLFTPGGFGAPADPTTTALSKLPSVEEIIKNALSGPCSSLFSGPVSPVDVLQGLGTGGKDGKFGSIQFTDLSKVGRGSSDAETDQRGTPDTAGLYSQADIYINNQTGNPGFWNQVSDTGAAKILLHELGHVYAFLYGQGSTKFLLNDQIDDTQPIDSPDNKQALANQQQNQKLEQCIK